MPERIREVVVAIEVDTNKKTRTERLELRDEESIAKFTARVSSAIDELTEIE